MGFIWLNSLRNLFLYFLASFNTFPFAQANGERRENEINHISIRVRPPPSFSGMTLRQIEPFLWVIRISVRVRPPVPVLWQLLCVTEDILSRWGRSGLFVGSQCEFGANGLLVGEAGTHLTGTRCSLSSACAAKHKS